MTHDSFRAAAVAPREGSAAPLPFRSVLSLAPLLALWRSEEIPSEGMRAEVEEALRQTPVLARPSLDPRVLEAHRDLLERLTVPLFPLAFRERDLSAALAPVGSDVLYATPHFRRLLLEETSTGDGATGDGAEAPGLSLLAQSRTAAVGVHVLQTVYGLSVPAAPGSGVAAVPDPATGLDRYYRIRSDPRFVEVRCSGGVPPLSEEARRELLAHPGDFAAWHRHVPAEAFSLCGFEVVELKEVTDAEAISHLQRDLLQLGGVVSGASLPALTDRLRILLRCPDLHLGLAALEDEHLFLLNRQTALSTDGLFSRTAHPKLSEVEGSPLERCLRRSEIEVIPDLAASADPTVVEQEMLQAGVRALLSAPLLQEEHAVGVLYLWSERPGAFDASAAAKLQEVLPLFAGAVQQGKEDLRNRVHAVILDQYTSVHPAVAWRFRRAALRFLRRQEQGLPAVIEPIVFEDVYPLYAAADIRGSSSHRNEAVRADLLDHIALAQDVLRQAHTERPLPLLDHLQARLDRHRTGLSSGLSSGDEANIRDLLLHDVEPTFVHLRTFAPHVEETIEAYFRATDTGDGSLYRRLDDFEQSVSRINTTICTYLDEEERKAQALFPHYFEKHQTDGVEFNIYAGASMLETGTFDPLYVRNLRLWQLMVVCEIARRTEALKPSLAVPLETTHLILTQSMPIAIRFRFDETRFDVDGAHHIRFEIMKQRVEKASIRGTKERLTQPGKIAVVYSQAREALEYEAYIAFLQDRGLLTGAVEHVELDDLQGMRGLKALRVQVAFGSKRTQAIPPEDLERAARAVKN